jgi:hypothetical protein
MIVSGTKQIYAILKSVSSVKNYRDGGIINPHQLAPIF